MALPNFQNNDRDFQLMQTAWANQLNPLLANPITKGVILQGINLVSGNNVINTKLGRKAQGWMITDTSAAVQVYRSAPFNELTLTLNSSGSATVNILVF